MELALLRARLDAFQHRFYEKAGAMYLTFDEARDVRMPSDIWAESPAEFRALA
jgi:hypothetical protein